MKQTHKEALKEILEIEARLNWLIPGQKSLQEERQIEKSPYYKKMLKEMFLEEQTEIELLKSKAQEIADEHKFEGGAIYSFSNRSGFGKTEMQKQIKACKEIQEVNERIRNGFLSSS